MAGLRSIPKIGKLTQGSSAKVIATPPPLATSQGRPMPNPQRFTVFPQGPELLRLGQNRDTDTGGPGEKPATFPGTQPEWVWFWASIKLARAPDPRITGDFTGASTAVMTFLFQHPENPSRPKGIGESVSDFVYAMPSGQQIIVRIEGFYWHIGKGALEQARDAYLMTHVGQIGMGDRAIRVNDSEFMFDAKGVAAIQLLAAILANRPPVGRLQGGIVAPPRYAEFAA